MNKYQRSRLDSYNLMIFEAGNFEISIAKVPKFANAMLKLKEVSVKIQAIQVQQERDITGVAEDKHKTLNQLIDLMVEISGALQSYALEKENNTLHERINFTESTIDKLPHSVINNTAELIIEEADKLTPEELTAEGISAEELTELKSLQAKFKVILQAPRQAIIDRSNQTEELRELFSEAADIKKKVLDNLITQFKRKDPEFYRKYTAASNVIYRHGTGKNSNEEADSEEIKE